MASADVEVANASASIGYSLGYEITTLLLLVLAIGVSVAGMYKSPVMMRPCWGEEQAVRVL